MNMKVTALIILLLLVAALLGLLHASKSMHAQPASRRAASHPALRVHHFGDASVHTPSHWVQLSSGADHVTWGTSDRSATLTLGDIPASPLPPSGALRAAYSVLQHDTGSLTELKLIDTDHDTATSIGEFQVTGTGPRAGDRISVRQAWRRVTRGDTHRDLIATWTLRAGSRWSAPPDDLIPFDA